MVEVSESRLNYLKQWRKARKLEREIACCCAFDSEGEHMDETGQELLGLKLRDFTHLVCAGDVRLLSDNLTVHAAEPRYVAVLAILSRGMAICAPFSRYPVPATKDEWLTGLKSPCLKVLQLWNAQPCMVRCLAQSWKVTSLDDRRLSRALMLYKHSVNHTFPAENDREDIGVAIVSERDERNDYMSEEYTEFAPLFSSVADMIDWMNSVSDRIVGMSVLPMFENVAAVALAAADERRNPFAKGVIEGSDVAVTVEYEMDKKILRVKVRNAANTYEGWSVWTTSNVDSQELGIIENGLLVVYDVDEESLRVGLAFASPDGKTIKQFVPHRTDK